MNPGDESASVWSGVERAEKLATLSTLTRLIISAQDSQQAFQAVAQAAATLLGAKLARVWVEVPEGRALRIQASFGLDPEFERAITNAPAIPYGGGLIGRICESRLPEYLLDIQQDPRWLNQRLATEGDLHAFAGLPLIAGGRVVGVLSILFGDRRQFTPEEKELMGFLADQAAIAIHNARLFEETERRRRAAEGLAETSRLISQSLDPEEVGQRIVDNVRALLGACTSALYRLEPEAEDLVALAVSGDVGPTFGRNLVLPQRSGVAGLAVRERRPVVTSDLLTDPRIALPPEVRARIEQASFRAVLAVPLLVKDTVIGALGVGDRAGRVFNGEEIRVAQAFADQAAVALANARLHWESKARQVRLEALLEVNRQLSRIQPLESLLGSLAETCGNLLGTDSVGFRLLEGNELVVMGTCGDAREAMVTPRLRIGESLSGRIAATGEPLIVKDLANDPRLIPAHREADRRLGHRAFLGVPMKVGERVVGVLSVRTRQAKGFSAEDVAVATAFASQAAIALDNSRLYGELRAALETVEASQQRLVQTERLRALGEMAAGVAHDFNNLLAVILGRAELLLARTRDPEVARALEALRTAALGGAQTVRRIQEFTRTRRTRPFGRVDLRAVLQEVVDLTRPRWKDDAQSRGVAYDVRVEGDPAPPVAGISEELREVFTNLLINALEAMPAGGRLIFRVVSEAAGVVVTTEDTGCGMSEETCRRVFEPFFTTKGPRGTGLGLAVVWGIITRHGGTIEAASTLGVGTTFTIRLPVGRELPAEETPAPLPRPARTARVLVIDDDPEVRAVVRDLLTEEGYTVIEAAGGREGLARCEAEPVDLVLTDLSMPEVSGWEVAAACRERFPAVPVGLITGWGDQLDPTELERHRIRFVLAKPFGASDVLREVARALNLTS